MSLRGFGEAFNEEARGGEGKRVLVGYSMGARLALHALLAKGPWDAAILVAPHPGLEMAEERAERRVSDARWAGLAMSGDWREFLTEWGAQPLLAGVSAGDPPPESSRREIARSFVDWSLGAQEPLWQRLPEISCPVLWCVGERDQKFRELGERAVGLLPNAELWIAAGAGHRVPWEQPEAFRSKVGEFLERVLS